jgi:5-methylcytosine-specific restriction endonuclease McrA
VNLSRPVSDAEPAVFVTQHESHARSPHWPTARKHFLEQHPACEACGTTKDLNVHHVVPFHEDPSKILELDPANMITLCREHHFLIGHQSNWKDSNRNVRADAAALRRKLNPTRGPPHGQ